jgi:hypothetical protein
MDRLLSELCTYGLGKFVGVDAKNVRISVGPWRTNVTKERHQGIISLSVAVEITINPC